MSEEASALDPALEHLVCSFAERLCAGKRFRSAARALADWLEKHPDSAKPKSILKACIQAWCQSLTKVERGAEAVRVAWWGTSVLAGDTDLQGMVQQLQQSFGPVSLSVDPPLATAGVSLSAENEARRARLLADPSRPETLTEIHAELSADPHGDSRAALHFFRQLALEHPQSAAHQINLGWVYLQAKQSTLALVHTQRGLALESSERGRHQLAEIYRALGQPGLAEEALA